MALSSADRSWIQIHQNDMMTMMSELIRMAVHDRQAISLAAFRTRMAGRGVDSTYADELITYWDTLGTLLDS